MLQNISFKDEFFNVYYVKKRTIKCR